MKITDQESDHKRSPSKVPKLPLSASDLDSIKQATQQAFFLYQARHPAEMAADADINPEEQIETLTDEVIAVFQSSTKPITHISPDRIYLALENSAGLTITEALDQQINPPPFDPFNL